MTDNTALVEYNGITVYANDIDLLCDEYISTLPDASVINKSAGFMGLLNYIYKRSIKNILPDNYNNDYNLLDVIFNNIYIPMCYRYNKVPTVAQFSVLVGIDNTYIAELKSGVYKDGSRVNKNTTHIVQKWSRTCEAALENKAIEESSIGSIFVLKSRFQWRDNTTLTLETGQQTPHESAEQIAQRHSAARIPEAPQLDD